MEYADNNDADLAEENAQFGYFSLAERRTHYQLLHGHYLKVCDLVNEFEAETVSDERQEEIVKEVRALLEGNIALCLFCLGYYPTFLEERLRGETAPILMLYAVRSTLEDLLYSRRVLSQD